jgi:cysteinyl-tRNA synthetase
MTIRIYNTLTRKKEEFKTLVPGQVSMYVCGPTVYSNAHIGHAMSAMVFDIIRRYMEYRGYGVRYVMNYTDVDDKIITRAKQLGTDPFELAEKYINDYRKNLQDLNILPATVNPRATREMKQIIQMINDLGESGAAYEVDGDVYFRVTKDPDYGKLSGRQLEDMQAGARIDVDDRKENPLDFALWKAAKPGEPAWDSPWGKGRPGWHIECSAMNLAHLGEQIDIHGGGNDLIFPHHENEIAQTESITGKPFARYWVHNGMVQLGGEKMSKSTGNLVTIDEFLSRHHANALRLIVLNSAYRNPLTFTEDVITQAEKAIERLQSALRLALPAAKGAPQPDLDTLKTQVETTRAGFLDSMDDDFNSAGALGFMFELVRVINQARGVGATDHELDPAQSLLRELTDILGLQLNLPGSVASSADPFIDMLVSLRSDLRKLKLWVMSDQIRDRLAALDVIIEDTKEGTIWRWKS